MTGLASRALYLPKHLENHNRSHNAFNLPGQVNSHVGGRKRKAGARARKCPKEPATECALGSVKRGLDKKMYKVVKNERGEKRWKVVSTVKKP